MKQLLLGIALAIANGQVTAEEDLSNPQRLLAVADRAANIVDVVDVTRGSVAHRFETAFRADRLALAPHAPILAYANIERRLLVFINLETKGEIGRLELPLAPRHVVLDPSGGKLGITDSEAGGFALVSLYAQTIEFALEDFPPTGDVLFDPNEVDVYYSNDATASLGLLDMNQRRREEVELSGIPGQALSPPSRSLDARHIYVANAGTGEVYGLNAFSRVVFRAFEVGASPTRPYTTPQGSFLYMSDRESGRLLIHEQGRFNEYADVSLDEGVDLVAVGRFDRYTLFLSTSHPNWYAWDNLEKRVVSKGRFRGRPLDARGAADGRTAYVAFADRAEMAMVDLEHQAVRYFPVTENGAGAFAIGLSNNVCH